MEVETGDEDDEYNEKVEQEPDLEWEDHQMKRRMTRKEVIWEKSKTE